MARRAWRTPGPYLMALAFALVIAPNVWWLVDHDFMPFHYVDARAKTADALVPIPSLSAAMDRQPDLLPVARDRTSGVAVLGLDAQCRTGTGAADRATFDRRYVTALALGPFAVTTLVAAVLGRLPVAMWGYPLWSFAPLAALMWLGPNDEPARLRRFARRLRRACSWPLPLIYAAIEIFEPFVRDRTKATAVPGQDVRRDGHQTVA